MTQSLWCIFRYERSDLPGPALSVFKIPTYCVTYQVHILNNYHAQFLLSKRNSSARCSRYWLAMPGKALMEASEHNKSNIKIFLCPKIRQIDILGLFVDQG